MQIFKRTMALALTLVMVFSMVPGGAFAEETQPTTEVDTGDLTIEGTNGFGALLSAEIAEEQAEAADAESDYEAGYSVTDLVIEGNTATVTYDSLEDALLIVALYSEDGMQLLTSGTAEVTADNSEATVTIEGDMPEYFMASTYLVDAYDLSPLCAAYETPMYTAEMQWLLESTVDDYEPELVLNLDDDETTNFAVFEYGVQIIEPQEGVNIVTRVDEENAVYVIENVDERISALEPGQIFVYPYAEEQILIVKIADLIVDDDGVATIGGGELNISEVFSHIKIESTGDMENAEVEEDSGTEAVSYAGRSVPIQTFSDDTDSSTDTSSASFNFTIFYESEPDADGMNVEVKGDLQLYLDTEFSFHKAGALSHIRFKTDTVIDFGISIMGQAKVPVLPLKKINIPFNLPCIKMYCEPELTLRLDAGIKLNGRFTATTVSTISLAGYNFYFTDMDLEWHNVEFHGEIQIFFNLNPTVSVEETVLFATLHIVKLKIHMPLGVRLKFLDETADFTNAEKKHACEKCFKIPVDFVWEISFRIMFLDKPELGLDIPLSGEQSRPLFHLYWSLDYGEFAKGDCPHFSYRVTTVVTDENGKPFPDVRVDIGDKKAFTNANGVAYFYVTPGTYAVTASTVDSSCSKSVKIEDACKLPITLLKDGGTDSESDIGGILDEVDSETVTDMEEVVDSGIFGGSINWTIHSDGLLRIFGQGAMPNFTYSNPAPWYSYRDSISAVVIERGVTSIGNYAFYENNHLTSVKIPQGVTYIGECAFARTSLISVVIPDGVVSIGRSAFVGCSLISVTIPDSVTFIGRAAFFECYNLTSVEIPDSVTFIAESTFYDCDNLTTVTIPDSVTSIGERAFYDCDKLTSVTIPDSVTSVGLQAFYDCDSLKNVKISANLTSIEFRTFAGCTKLKSVTIPGKVTSIGERAFVSCSGLTSLKILDGVTSIGIYAFSGCRSMTSVWIPASVTSIGNNGFYYCDSLTDVYYGGTKDQWNAISIGGNNACLTNATIHYNSVAEVEQSTNVEQEGVVALNAVYPGEYGTEESENGTLKTASFTGLVPGRQYVMLSLVSLDVENPLAADNLLYIDQGEADEDGTLVFKYVQRTPAKISYVMACGPSNKNLEDAEIIFPEMITNGELQVVNPTVVYDGETLLEGIDYVIVGTVDYTEAGEYACYIRGIRQYTGLVECTYQVTESAEALGDLDLDGDVDAYDLTALARHVGGIELITGQALLSADVDGDGDVDAYDLTKHARYVGGIITSWDQE